MIHWLHTSNIRVAASLSGAHVSKQIALMWPEHKNTGQINKCHRHTRTAGCALFQGNLINEEQGFRNLISFPCFTRKE